MTASFEEKRSQAPTGLSASSAAILGGSVAEFSLEKQNDKFYKN